MHTLRGLLLLVRNPLLHVRPMRKCYCTRGTEQAISAQYQLRVYSCSKRLLNSTCCLRLPPEHELRRTWFADRRRCKPREPVRIRVDPILHSPPPTEHNLRFTKLKVIHFTNFSRSALSLSLNLTLASNPPPGLEHSHAVTFRPTTRMQA